MIQRCLLLGARGLGTVAPNPMVGAVITCGEHIIGEGFHTQPGSPHAEVIAIDSVKDHSLLAQSTLYVNLEPCCHHGRTPPCTDLIASHKIKRVVFGGHDPYPKVAGGGARALRNHGILIEQSLAVSECIHFNRRFYCNQILKRPYLILKWAQTTDGFIARKDLSSQWISSERSRREVHRWRNEESAVLVGYRTAFHDNPRLNVRMVSGKNPMRITLDREGILPSRHNLLDNSIPTIIFTAKPSRSIGLTRWISIPWENPFPAMLSALHSESVQSILIEGGAAILNKCIELDYWDEARVFASPQLFHEGIPAPRLQHQIAYNEQIDTDLLTIFENHTTLQLKKFRI